MAKTMRAAVVHGFGKPLGFEEVPVPEPGPGEVLVKIVASGICHTDLHAARGDWPVKPSPPFIPGHEGAGFGVARGAVKTRIHPVGLTEINRVFADLQEGKVEGRMVLMM